MAKVVGERVVEVEGVRLCLEGFGDPGDPAILLVAGMGSPMDLWEPGFCAALSARGRFVVRYDHRDTGRSQASPPGHPDYTFADLVEDGRRVLDALDLRESHLVGMSMGGAIAQVLAAVHPERVRTLTLVATGCAGTRAGTDPLPQSDAALFAEVEAIGPEPDWQDRAAASAYLASELMAYARPAGRDRARLGAQAAIMVARSTDPASMHGNHALAEGGDVPDFAMADLAAPTLVLHGTDDRLFPLAHGEALAAEVPGARLVVMDGMGHEAPPPPLWDKAIGEIVTHTA